MNQTDDMVRRQESRPNRAPKYSRYLWLKEHQVWMERQNCQHHDHKRLNLKTLRASQINVAWRGIFSQAHVPKFRYPLARRYRVASIKQQTESHKHHSKGILNGCVSKLNKGWVDGVNSHIQANRSKSGQSAGCLN